MQVSSNMSVKNNDRIFILGFFRQAWVIMHLQILKSRKTAKPTTKAEIEQKTADSSVT